MPVVPRCGVAGDGRGGGGGSGPGGRQTSVGGARLNSEKGALVVAGADAEARGGPTSVGGVRPISEKGGLVAAAAGVDAEAISEKGGLVLAAVEEGARRGSGGGGVTSVSGVRLISEKGGLVLAAVEEEARRGGPPRGSRLGEAAARARNLSVALPPVHVEIERLRQAAAGRSDKVDFEADPSMLPPPTLADVLQGTAPDADGLPAISNRRGVNVQLLRKAHMMEQIRTLPVNDKLRAWIDEASVLQRRCEFDDSADTDRGPAGGSPERDGELAKIVARVRASIDTLKNVLAGLSPAAALDDALRDHKRETLQQQQQQQHQQQQHQQQQQLAPEPSPSKLSVGRSRATRRSLLTSNDSVMEQHVRGQLQSFGMKPRAGGVSPRVEEGSAAASSVESAVHALRLTVVDWLQQAAAKPELFLARTSGKKRRADGSSSLYASDDDTEDDDDDPRLVKSAAASSFFAQGSGSGKSAGSPRFRGPPDAAAANPGGGPPPDAADPPPAGAPAVASSSASLFQAAMTPVDASTSHASPLLAAAQQHLNMDYSFGLSAAAKRVGLTLSPAQIREVLTEFYHQPKHQTTAAMKKKQKFRLERRYIDVLKRESEQVARLKMKMAALEEELEEQRNVVQSASERGEPYESVQMLTNRVKRERALVESISAKRVKELEAKVEEMEDVFNEVREQSDSGLMLTDKLKTDYEGLLRDLQVIRTEWAKRAEQFRQKENEMQIMQQSRRKDDQLWRARLLEISRAVVGAMVTLPCALMTIKSSLPHGMNAVADSIDMTFEPLLTLIATTTQFAPQEGFKQTLRGVESIIRNFGVSSSPAPDGEDAPPPGDGKAEGTVSGLDESARQPIAFDSKLVEQLQEKLEMLATENRSKFREMRYIKHVIQYVCSQGDALIVNGAAELPRDEDDGQFPPRSVVAQDKDYAYAWIDERKMLDEFLSNLSRFVTHGGAKPNSVNSLISVLGYWKGGVADQLHDANDHHAQQENEAHTQLARAGSKIQRKAMTRRASIVQTIIAT
ncbi:hypothetical protein DIPPA_14269 [Diplonema papillatum]|nr:hypothetical protein DIPPA_14269 [Diplonema papillatum]